MSNCVYKSVDMMNTGDFVRKESCMKEYINSDNGKVSIERVLLHRLQDLQPLTGFGNSRNGNSQCQGRNCKAAPQRQCF